jgi:hypothetical protein
MINEHRETFGDKEKDSVAWLRTNLLRVLMPNLRDLKGFAQSRTWTAKKAFALQVEEILRITQSSVDCLWHR